MLAAPGVNSRFLHADERGSVVALSNASGAAIATWQYSPGACPGPRSGGQSTGSSFSRFGFTGQTVIEGTEIMHFKARAYSPALGRFLQPDPIGFAGGNTNLYSYAANDPVNFTDPSGLIFGKIFKGLKKAAKFVVKGAKKVVKAANKVSKFAGPATILINPEAALVNRIIAAAALARTGSGLIGGESTGAEGGDAGKDDNGSLFTRVGNFFSNVVDTASDHHDDFREKHCFVGKIEGVFGLVGEFSARGVGPGGVPVGISGSLDVASVRVRLNNRDGFTAVVKWTPDSGPPA